MAVLIESMEMPKEGFVEILIRDDGTVQQTGKSYRIDGTDYYTSYIGEMPVMYKAVPVPPHGRLIDADAFISTIRPLCEEDKFAACTFETVKRLMVEHINNTPTIIPASKEVST
ncbi:hypothetical protein [Methanobrevibacter sp.]|uniref:hypothetical protein n=1 Tax=Methanobrevibacter sp. TaxID=66852 RepID=UPI003869EAB7